jgi:hypothetical protein
MNKDYSIEEIEKMLSEKQHILKSMEKTTRNSSEQLKKINKRLDIEQQMLVDIVSKMALIQSNIVDLDDYAEKNDIFSKKIKTVSNNLRNIRNSLAYIIRKN